MWESVYGHTFCAMCQPPPAECMVARRFELAVAAGGQAVVEQKPVTNPKPTPESEFRDPFDDDSNDKDDESMPPLPQDGKPCPRCGCTRYFDTSIHDGRSRRRDCAKCRYMIGFPVWYGKAQEPNT